MTPRPIDDQARDGRLIVGLTRVGEINPHWDGHTMFYSRRRCINPVWVYTGILSGLVPEGCEPTHYLPLEGAADDA